MTIIDVPESVKEITKQMLDDQEARKVDSAKSMEASRSESVTTMPEAKVSGKRPQSSVAESYSKTGNPESHVIGKRMDWDH